MTETKESTRVLVISQDNLILESVKTAFNTETDFVLLDQSFLAEGNMQAVQALLPDIVLLDYQFPDEDAYKITDQIVTQLPSCVVVVILPEQEVQKSNQMILAGARAFLISPFTQTGLLETLRRVRELQSRALASKPPPEKAKKPSRPRNTFVVYSPKGGAGSTTIAINLAIALHKVLGEEVLLIDGKHFFGHVSLMLNLRTANSIADLISHSGKLDAGLIRQVALKHVSGIQVLPSPTSISEAQGIRPDDLYRVILGLQSVYPNIIVDGGSFLDENTVTYMDSAYRVLLVVTPNLASLRDARQFLDICRTLSYPAEKELLILNQTGRKTDIKLQEIEKVLHAQVIGRIPADDIIALSSMNEGVPIILKKPKHPISKEITKIAQELVKMLAAVGPMAQAEDEKAQEDMLKKTSRLG